MIENSTALLLYLSYTTNMGEVLHMTPRRLYEFRKSVCNHQFPESYISEVLTKMGCICVRPRIELPCIVKDKNGRLYDGNTYSKMFFTHEMAEKYGYEYNRIMGRLELGQSINRALFKHILKSRRAWIVYDHVVLDSVWSYEPIEITMTAEKVKQIREMIARANPFEHTEISRVYYSRQACSEEEH